MMQRGLVARLPLIAGVLLVAAGPAAAEVTVAVNQGRIDLTARDAPLADVLDRLARQIAMQVTYEGTPPRSPVTAEVQAATPVEAVLSVLEGMGVNYALQLDRTGREVRSLLLITTRSSSTPRAAGRAEPPPAPTPRVPPPPPLDEDEDPMADDDEPALEVRPERPGERMRPGRERPDRPGMFEPAVPSTAAPVPGPAAAPTPSYPVSPFAPVVPPPIQQVTPPPQAPPQPQAPDSDS